MTSAEIRQSFLDFFKSKGHTIVPSSSLMPDSPGLLFTNAGMNQFVPIFLNERAPDVDKWPGAIAGRPTRAADTQKCIRAGGKHNDLEDVGLDTYHHTFFEMLGNWSFGDYFKKEAIDWAWELVVGQWHFPPKRLYATVFCPDMNMWQHSLVDAIRYAEHRLDGVKVEGLGDEVTGGAKGSGAINWPDDEAASYWAECFLKAGLDPVVHIIPGNRKDNFWMMGETGPCGPCSELHVDLTPNGDTCGNLVNKGDARCIEIWNLVFIQFNANPDGSFTPLPAKHVDTGMGFERVTGIMQNTKRFSDFSCVISNYETDIFRPLFDRIEKLSGKQYKSTLPKSGATGETDQEKIDVAFRVIADHIRTLSFSIADGILPGNNDRNYVLRRILRRAVRYGRTLGFHEAFLYKLVDVLAEKMGGLFPELRARKNHVQEVVKMEEEVFNKTLDTGIDRFDGFLVTAIGQQLAYTPLGCKQRFDVVYRNLRFASLGLDNSWPYFKVDLESNFVPILKEHGVQNPIFPGNFAFELYDTYGFPLDLTQLMAREKGLSVDTAGFEKLMEEQRARARAAQKKEVVAASNVDTSRPTRFVGFEQLQAAGTVLEVVNVKDKLAVTLDVSPMYAEMGGQVGDTGEAQAGGKVWHIVNTQKAGNTFLHFLADKDGPEPGARVELRVNAARRGAIQRHHSVTHLLHWALHEVASPDATQKGSYVGPDKLTFDFSSAPLTATQVSDVEKLVNERILENAGVTWSEVPYAEVKGRKEIMQFFGEKYGERVRVVQIGGKAGALDGYSMELCGGTHTRATGEVGLFRIVSESAVAAGIRRIEAVAGLRAYEKTREEAALISSVAGKINAPVADLEKKIESLLAQQKDLEKQLEGARQKQAAETARVLAAKANRDGTVPYIVENLGAADVDSLQAAADALKGQFKGVIVLGGAANGAVALVAAVAAEFTGKFHAGKIMQAIAPVVGGRGGGRPDNARGGGKEVSKLEEALNKARAMLAGPAK
jgi:alanyl-tRNA synthetase